MILISYVLQSVQDGPTGGARFLLRIPIVGGDERIKSFYLEEVNKGPELSLIVNLDEQHAR
jgi:hypothetical protein